MMLDNNKTITLDDVFKEIEEAIALVELQKAQTKELEDRLTALHLRILQNEAH